MKNKSLFLGVMTISLLASNQPMHATVSDEAVAGYVAAGIVGTALAATGIYKLGQKCDIWGNPDPYTELTHAHNLIGIDAPLAAIEVPHTYTHADEDFLYHVCLEGIHNLNINHSVYSLEECRNRLIDCLRYARKSRHYRHDYSLHEKLESAHQQIAVYHDKVKRLADYLYKHSAYTRLFNEEKQCIACYTHEFALYNSYAYQPELLKQEIYNVAQCQYAGPYAIIKYAEKLSCAIVGLQNCISKALLYPVRLQRAQELLNAMRFIHQLIVNDTHYHVLVQQQARVKAEEERLRRERERLEFERMQANAERARLAREREYAAMRERERLQAEYDRLNRERYNNTTYTLEVNVHDTNKRDADYARREADRQRAEADRQRAQAQREYQEKERLAQEKRDAECRAREAEERLQQERLERRANERKAREEEEARAVRKREEEEKERKRRKQQKIAQEQAQKAAEEQARAKLEADMYTTFYRFE